MIYVGIDPDTHSLPIASLSTDPDLDGVRIPQGWLWLEILRVPAKLKGDDAMIAMAQALNAHGELNSSLCDVLCVESQYYSPKSKSKPQDIGRLSFVSGAAGGAIGCMKLLTPTPSQWKGSVPKVTSQARTALKLGWAAEVRGEYLVPSSPQIRGMVEHLTDWKHAFDSIGLALWAMEEIEKTKARANALQAMR